MASGLLGPDGKAIEDSIYKNKRDSPPKTGAAFGQWAGREFTFASLPGGGVVQFDLSRLTLSDYRQMTDHYQVNSSLAVLSFMQHQSDYHIECDDKAIAEFCQGQIDDIWTQLNRAMSQANWAGYSPNVLEWENNLQTRKVDLNKIKDLVPEECRVNWKEVPGWAPPGRTPPKFKIYDGIKQYGQGWPIPVDNSFWYPLLMQNGDYYGKKLLRPAFTSWFFSILVHMFANRYYERFGEPTPIGRAPFDDTIDVGGDEEIKGSTYMGTILSNLRSRGVVVLPNDVTDIGGHGNSKPHYDYDIEYLESQMRGADFERYLTRLDEEISLGLFTPILLMRTADVGSYNLGVGHMQMYLWMLNAMNDDRASYINRYILRPMINYNFSPNAPDARIKFRKLGNVASDMLQAVLVALIQKEKAIPDLDQLGQMTGMTIKQVRQTLKPVPASSGGDGGGDGGDGGDGGGTGSGSGGNNRNQLEEVRATANEILNRVQGQVQNAFRDHSFGPSSNISLGFKRRFERALEAEGVSDPVRVANNFFGQMDHWVNEVKEFGESEFSGPESFMALFKRVLIGNIEMIENQQSPYAA